jgi:hypothetical protein
MLGCWDTGMLRRPGTLGRLDAQARWDAGMLGHWDAGTLRRPGTLGHNIIFDQIWSSWDQTPRHAGTLRRPGTLGREPQTVELGR